MAVRSSPRADVLVLGAGPAASLAALRLAREGRSVCLVGRPDTRPRWEGASPRVVALLAAEGLTTDAIGPAVRRTARWAGLPTAANAEHPVDRCALDRDLLALARAGGVAVIEADVTALRGTAATTSAGDFTAPRVIEARGRRAPAGAGARRGPATLAIAGWVAPADAATVAAGPGTALTATAMGWQWQLAPGDGRLWVQICLDAADARAGTAAAWAAFQSQPGLGQLPLPVAPLVRGSALRLTAPVLDPDCLRVGDAAVALDPLSGHGLFWALSSALMVPPLLAAIEAGEAELAQRFYADRVTATFWRQSRISRDFHALVHDAAGSAAGGTTAGPFWSARAAWPDSLPAHPGREAPALARRIIVADGRLVEAEVLLTPQEPDGVAFVRGLPLAPVLARFGPGPLPDPAAFAAACPALSPAEAGFLHGWLASRGVGLAAPDPATIFPLPPTETQPVETQP